MLLIWLAVWLIYGAPSIEPWNGWLVSAIVCAVLTVAPALRYR